MYKSEGEYVKRLSEECDDCKEEIYSPMEDHYVNDPESPLNHTCKNILRREKYLTCYYCRGKLDPFNYENHYKYPKYAKGCRVVSKKSIAKSWKEAKTCMSKKLKRAEQGVKAFGRWIKKGFLKAYNVLRVSPSL